MYLAAVSRSPNRNEAIIATDRGCESIIILPKPADVRCRPSARNPCKRLIESVTEHSKHKVEEHNFVVNIQHLKTCCVGKAKYRNP